MAEKHMAMIYVSEELLREALAMPEGSKIVDIRRQNKWQGVPVFEMLVEHEDLPVVPEGDDLPLVTRRSRLITRSGREPG